MKENYDICVVGGSGHVGLPLSIALADKGFRVIIYDKNSSANLMINNGKMPFLEEGCDSLLQRNINIRLWAKNDIKVISQSHIIIIIIGTPVDEHLNPRYGVFNDLIVEILPYLNNEQIIVLRSTVYPGTTEYLNTKLKNYYPDIPVCFCPERIAEGRAMEELFTLPQIISGFEDRGINEVKFIFSKLTKDIITVSPLEAELVKLFTNAWRYIQFATANQFYMFSREYKADFYNIYDAMTFNYPRTSSFPKPGFAAGPCLFKDTMQISAFTNNKFFLGHSAMLINEGLPNFIVSQLKAMFDLRQMTVGILGMAFKAESDDIRESLSYKLKKILEFEVKKVICSDSYVKDPCFISAEELITSSDIIIIGVPHNTYKNLDYKDRLVYDVWNFTMAYNKIY